VITVISQHGHPVLIAVIAIVAALAALIFILVTKRKERGNN
jgi:exosome complex RNA-binding protein Rrp42 (RNase PH superfamily)